MIKRRRRVRWNRVLITFIVVIALVLGVYKGVIYIREKIKANETNEVTQTLFNKIDELIPTVVLDSGHGGVDVGANDGSLYEKDIVLSAALYAGAALENDGIRVIYTRTTDVALDDDKATDLKMRAQMSATYHANVFVSIHVNDYDGNSQPSGFEIYVKDEQSEALATSIGEYIEDLNYSKNRGVIDGSDLAVLRYNTVPSVLIELGYIKGADATYLKDSQKLESLGEAIAEGIKAQLQTQLSN